MTIVLVLDGPLAGGLVVSFPSVAPRARFDDVRWTRVLIEESSAKTGPWEVLVDGDIDPLDDDPADPQERDITVRGAQLEQGWYRITFLDDVGGRSPIAPVYQGDSWAPSVQDVADKVAEYTRARASAILPVAGAPTGHFGADTVPTAEQVRGYIRAACTEVAGRANVEIPARCYDVARAAATCHAAAAVEASKGAGGTDEADGAYRFHIASYRFNLDELIRKARELAQSYLA